MQRLRRRSPSPALVVAFIALFAAAGGGWAVAAQNAASTIRACVSKKTGAVRLSSRCKRKTERTVSWNAAGRAGRTGLRGAQGPPGPAGPFAVFEADRDGGSGGAADGVEQQIATLNLPAGTYTITGKARITRQGAGATIGSCTLAAGTDTDTANALLSQTLTVGSTVVAQVSHTFPAAGAATLTCTAIGGSWVADKAKVIAIKAGTLTRTAVTG